MTRALLFAMKGDNGDLFKTTANKVQAIDALLTELARNAYATRG